MAGPATSDLNSDIVTASFQKLGIVGDDEAPDAAQGQVGLTCLNDMLADWAADGIWLGWWPQTSLAATAPLEASDVKAVKLSLVLELSAHYAIAPPQAVLVAQDEAYQKLVKRYIRYNESASELPREQAVVDRTGQNL